MAGPCTLAERTPPFFALGRGWRSPLCRAWDISNPAPFRPACLRRVLDLPSSHVSPVGTCCVLRPRWYPRSTAADRRGLLPSALCTASAFPLCRSIGFILRTTMIQISGLNGQPASSHPPGFAPWVTPDARRGSLPTRRRALVGWNFLPSFLGQSSTERRQSVSLEHL